MSAAQDYHTTLIFLRHGDIANPEKIVYGRLPLPLSNKGKVQIEAIAQTLTDMSLSPHTIYTSPLPRAVESAAILSSKFRNIPIITDNRLNELESKGLEGRPIAQVETPVGGDVYLHPVGYTVESPERIAARMVDCIRDIVKTHAGEIICVVSHGDPLAFGLWKLNHPDDRLPRITEIREKGGFLHKAETKILRFDKAGNILINY